MHPKLKETLERFYREYDLKSRIEHDPIEFPHRYDKPEEIEIAGMIASSLAYGNVTLFKPVINKILSVPVDSLREFIMNFDPHKDSRLFGGIKYRFNSEKDIICLIYFIKLALIGYGSLKNLFYSFYNHKDKNIANALNEFVKYFVSLDLSPVYGKREYTKGVKLFFPSPEDGSACKRLNLYLRWMVRSDDGVDFGIWDKIPPSKLIIPLDTHIARICIYLGLTRLKSAGWKMAEEITDNLKLLDPDDPVKYDFALCHLGISGECPLLSVRSSEFGIRGGGRLSRLSEKCCDCSLRNVCNWAAKKS
ncbi:MAG: TIGR02757 family protein [Nitrospinae bacterium RIFCSPLOWO2_02_FULL_39_110]|nr:MAG: TIGR02757 family protein [Nitrospinae bacterium RIFCSPHIGHO2_02_39_11]OGV97888.1 MAG: TIGR02757 family protein [Nitrospinae bacterium RIFCSPHIGHO2_12_FULL_39_42]OGW02510.1 MAG: TIGR02757 family protein [Nitrospinae bacterium RIFCSPHIGHO2_02_FULL_39_82]OGW06518.1 MAG: TIGR02757 family protein [Nitrospinae bacterium RIFCSPLOWO2_02_39_17]OGW06938.1 MAG: TIGR02757 family protein [Nitrospinae bacterium RIFCSPLOWO2_02_FULL_39_110]OGW08792.1 MAG: TIGR02757 family protein [Nitrospinae bacteriu